MEDLCETCVAWNFVCRRMIILCMTKVPGVFFTFYIYARLYCQLVFCRTCHVQYILNLAFSNSFLLLSPLKVWTARPSPATTATMTPSLQSCSHLTRPATRRHWPLQTCLPRRMAVGPRNTGTTTAGILTEVGMGTHMAGTATRTRR